MALPDGVTTCDLTFGGDTDLLGNDLAISVSVTPSQDVIWAATGQRIASFTVGIDLPMGTPGFLTLPHVNQNGFQDDAGNAVTNWYYTVIASYTNVDGRRETVKKVVAPVSGQAALDFDLVPGGEALPPTSLAIPGVTSVNGMTGVVTLGDLGVGLPGRTFLELPGPPIFFETFPDADGTIIANGQIGRLPQLGGSLVADGSGSTDRRAIVINGEQTWTTLPLNGSPIGILGPVLGDLPYAVKTRFRYIAGTTNTVNAVMGIGGGPNASGRPSFAQGSIQMCVYNDHAQIFCVPKPIVDPYPVLSTVSFPKVLEDGEIVEMLMVHDAAKKTVTGYVMSSTNGLTIVPTASCVYGGIDYWSKTPDGRVRVAWQVRRQLETDGDARFHMAGAC